MFGISRATKRALSALLCMAALATLQSGAAVGQSADRFYSGKTLRLIVGGGAGGGYDAYARLFAEHFGKHVPGNPNVIVENMPGAGGVKATNYLYNVAAKDGSVLGMPFLNNPVFQLIRPEGIRFDAKEFEWLGNMAELNSVVAVHEDAGVETVADAKEREVVIAASGKGAETYIYPTLLNAIADTKLRLVMGYRGTAPMTVAIERGEVQGRGGSWMSWKSINPEWVRDGRIRILAQAGLRKDPDLPDVPMFQDLAGSEENKAVVRLLSLPIATSRAVLAPPGTPEDRVAVLRKAFDETMKDRRFLEEAGRRLLEIKSMTGEEVQASIGEMFGTSPAVIERAKKMLDY